MSSSEPQLSVIVPVYEEGRAIVPLLDRLIPNAGAGAEVLVVFDAETDSTVPFLREYAVREPRLRPILNTYGRGPANALRFGLDTARAPAAVVVMGDGSDDVTQIQPMAEGIRRGQVIVAASRYMRGGAQVGGPFVKRTLSRLAGLSLHWLARVPIHDPTSNFKAYSLEFVRAVGIQSTEGFEIGLELVVKAHRLRLPMGEVPTVWRDRTSGTSHFRLRKWLPLYLRWYRFAFGPRLTLDQLRARSAGAKA